MPGSLVDGTPVLLKDARALYERVHHGRGGMENRIKLVFNAPMHSEASKLAIIG